MPASAGGPLRDLRKLSAMMGGFLAPAHKRRLLLVSLWACAVSLFEMLVAAAVIPYVQCLAGNCSAGIASRLDPLGWPIVPALSLGLFVLITIKLVVQACFNWTAAALGQQVQRDTVTRLLDGYMHQDWRHFRAQHRAHYFRRCATTAVDAAYVTQQCVAMISSSLLILFLVLLMLVRYPVASLVIGVAFLLINLVTQRLVGRRQALAAQRREAALQRWNVDMAEAFASFREIRVYGLERFFLQRLDGALASLATENRRLAFLPILPRLVLDFAVFGILLPVVSMWVLMGRPLAELVPQLVFYAVAARVLLPAMMTLISTRAQLYGSMVNIQLVLDELDTARAGYTPRVAVEPTAGAPAAFMLEAVGFAHEPQQAEVIAGVDLCIAHPSWVAVTGPSGAGKSTLMELLCGIHPPSTGRVVHRWPAGANPAPRVAYLPQHVALLDDTVHANVVFGFDAGDPARVEEALRLACLKHVVAGLPEREHTPVGADGGRLSGGERQRLALARALYRQPDLLLLDEATSGLDEPTEETLLSGLRAARPGMSVIFITHRPGSRRHADRVLRVAERKVSELAEGEAP